MHSAKTSEQPHYTSLPLAMFDFVCSHEENTRGHLETKRYY